MRIWFDTEFIEDGKTIDLISIGAVREDGECFYAESSECDLDRASPWVKENVLPHLNGFTVSRARIAADLMKFAGETPEFWAYYADYDWVALCQLFGTMMDLPSGWPMYCRDVKQLCDELGNPKLPEQTSTEHNSSADALWTKEAWEFLRDRANEIDSLRGRLRKGSMAAQWTYDAEAEAYYFAPLQAAPPPYLTQRHVDAILDIASDGTLAGVELIDNMPPPPSYALSSNNRGTE